MNVLTINGGSSSIKFALFQSGEPLIRLLSGKIDRIGLPDSTWSVAEAGRPLENRSVAAVDQTAAVRELIAWLDERVGIKEIAAVGHRIVHGGPRFFEPHLVTPELLAELHRISPFDPEHLPGEIKLIEAFAAEHQRLPQVACFDTSFHRDMPRVAQLLPIPRRFDRQGIRRYGFHGLSYAYLMGELERVAKPESRERVVLAHLGNGASLAAVKNGKCIDTSMGFTPTAGIPMSTRSGDLDPGLVWYVARVEGMTTEQFHDMVNRHSGLLGVSEISSDMRDLLAKEPTDDRAREAIDLFSYQVKKWIGGFTAALGGLDTLVFSGGIGENVPTIRTRICAGLESLGLVLDENRNGANAAVISSDSSRVAIRVIRTDEESVIAKSVLQVLDEGMPNSQ
jgi:acetate kinase